LASKILNKDIFPFSKNLDIVNADEHNELGEALNAGAEVQKVVLKRMKKEKQILKDSPKPIFYGSRDALNSIVCYGKTKGAVIDAINILGKSKLNMLCIESIWPIDVSLVSKFLKNAKRSIILEQNYSGQLKRIIEAETGLKIDETYNKFDGRAFSFEDILTFLK
jgi:2-oxoglutarate/2-oxoacid ferredoxin oxidoreductase subunit alpha